MEKPDAKKILLNMAEDNVMSILDNLVKPYAMYYIQESENKVDDILLPFLDSLIDEMKKYADKIDGEEG